MEPRPSSSIVLLSPTNQVLLLRRVKTSSSFASAHVFPGGNLSEFHDGKVSPPGDPARHEDSRAYRLGAVRETFEESGILLARDAKSAGGAEGGLLNLPSVERDAARKRIYENEVSFEEWLKTMGGEADLGMLDAMSCCTLSLMRLTRNASKSSSLYALDHAPSDTKKIYYADVSVHATSI